MGGRKAIAGGELCVFRQKKEIKIIFKTMIPDFQTIMLPFLEFFSDGKEHQTSEAIEYISNKFSLTDEERRVTYEKSRVRIIFSKVNFAKTYLYKAKLLERVGSGRFKITNRGSDLLKNKPDKIDISFLQQFPEFKEFRNRRNTDNIQEVDQKYDEQDPMTLLIKGYEKIRGDLAQELLDRVKQCSFGFFEDLVVELLLKMGYGGSREDAGEAIGKTNDGGIDGIIKEDKLGLDTIYIQAKKWDHPVGSPQITEFIGSLARKHANKGVFITTSTFTNGAQEAIRGIPYRIILIHGEPLAQLMIDYNIGVSEEANYEVKKIDIDYFSEE